MSKDQGNGFFYKYGNILCLNVLISSQVGFIVVSLSIDAVLGTKCSFPGIRVLNST